MDANFNKSLTGFLVAILVGSLFATVIVPTAEATHNGLGNPDVFIDVRPDVNPVQTVTINNGTPITYSSIAVPTNPSAGHIHAGTAYDLTFVGIEVDAGSGYGYTGGVNENVEIINASSGNVAVPGTQLSTGPDGATGHFKNASFVVTTTSFVGPGLYTLRTVTSHASVANIVIYPKEDISVTVSTNPSSATYTGNQVVVNIGTGVAGATLSSNASGFISNDPATDANGNYAFVSTLPMGAGTWNVFASYNTNPATVADVTTGNQCIPATTSPWGASGGSNCPASNVSCTSIACSSVPERTGNATLTINPNTIHVSANQTAAFVGFKNTVSANFTWPSTGNALFGSAADNTVTRWNLTVQTPGNFQYIMNGTSNLPLGITGAINLSAVGSWTCQNLAAGELTPSSCASPVAVSTHGPYFNVNSITHQLTFQNTTWESGTYTVWVQLETAGGANTPPEYVGSWSVNAGSAAAVNVEADHTTIDVPALDAGSVPTSTTNAAGAQGTVRVALTISGDTVYRHPLCDVGPVNATCTEATGFGSWEANKGPNSGTTHAFDANITLRGAVMPGWNITSYTPSTGVALVTFTPTANGTGAGSNHSVFFDVAWKNVTTTLEVPIGKGSLVTLDTSSITANTQTASTVTAHVVDAFGNPVSGATVFIIPRQTLGSGSPFPLSATFSFNGTGAATILGTGGAGAGQGGNYAFSINPSSATPLVVVAQTGSSGNVNYSYAPLNVLPNTALTTNINATRTMAGLRTQFVINVTNSTGIGMVSDPNYFQWYFLTAAQKKDLIDNGTTSLFNGATSLLSAGSGCDTATTTTPHTFALGAHTLCKASVTGSTANGTVTNVTLVAGDYYVYICSAIGSTTSLAGTDCTAATSDNRANMPMVNVTAYNATFDPMQIANNVDIQGATSVHIWVKDWAGNPANGTIGARANGTLTSSGDTFTATVTNGETNITLAGSNTGVGNVEWNFNPKEATGTDENAADRVMGVLPVVAGNLTFTPSKVSVGTTTLVDIQLANFTGGGLPGRVIRLCSVSLNSNFPTTLPTTLSSTDQTNCPDVGTTASDGHTGIVVNPRGLTSIEVYVNNSDTGRTIPVIAGTLVVTVSPTAPKAGDTVTFTVNQPGGAASVGSRILVTKNGTSVLDTTADGNGKATLASITEGTYTVTGIRSGFENGTATFTVGAAPVTAAAKFELSNLVLPATVNVGSPVTVSVNVKNTGDADGTATALLLVNNAQRDTQSVTLAAGANQTVAYTFTPTVAGTYAVSVKIGNTTVGPQNIVVGTPVTPTTTPTTATVTPTTVTPTTVTPTTVTPTTVTPTANPTTTTPTAATPATTSPRVPGFEVVALIGAIAVALIVLRRRN